MARPRNCGQFQGWDDEAVKPLLVDARCHQALQIAFWPFQYELLSCSHISIPITIMTSKSRRPKRVCGTPVRTGCITCKIRKVKCDEEKPSCKRCTSTGRKCDGYLPLPQVNSEELTKSLALVPAAGPPPIAPIAPVVSALPRSLPFRVNVDIPKEDRLLHFFFTTTATTLSGHFAEDFWLRRVPQALQFEPCIRHAVIAIAAIHQQFRFKHLSNLSIDDLHSFAFRQHAAAISKLQIFIASSHQQFDIPLIACILLVCFDSLLGNHSSALMHLKAGLNILQEQQSRQVTNLSASANWDSEFSPLLLILGIQAATFINPRKRKDRAALWKIMQCAGHLNSQQFQSFDQARHAIDTLAAKIVLERTSTPDRVSIGKDSNIPNPLGAQGRKHAELLESWLISLNQHIEHLNRQGLMDNKARCTASLLKIHWLMVSVTVGRPLPGEEKFAEMVYLCERLMDDDTKTTGFAPNAIFSTHMGIIAPLLLIAMRAPTMSLRLQGYTLLGKAPGREGMWDAEEGFAIAGRVLAAKDSTSESRFVPSLHARGRIWSEIWPPKSPCSTSDTERPRVDAIEVVDETPASISTPFTQSEES